MEKSELLRQDLVYKNDIDIRKTKMLQIVY